MKRTMFAAMFTLLFAVASFAQVSPYVMGSASTNSGFPLKNPDFQLGAGVGLDTQHYMFDVNGTFDTANNVITQNGITGTVTASGYRKIFKHILAGGGAQWAVDSAKVTSFVKSVENGQTKINRQVVDQTWQSAHPFVGGGFTTGRLTTIASYMLPGKDGYTNERIINLSNELTATKHIHLLQNTTFNSYVGDAGVRQLGTNLSAGVKLVF